MYSDYLHAIEHDDEPGYILSDMEYAKCIIHRPDIFAVDKDRRFKIILPITYFFGLVAIILVATVDLTVINPDFADRINPKYRVTLSRGEVSYPKKAPPEIPLTPEKKRTMAPHGKGVKAFSRQKGAGTPNIVVTNNGIFRAMADARIKSYGMDDVITGVGSATGLDAVIAGNMDLSQSRGTSFGRVEGGTVGTGTIGDGSGWGGGTDGVESLMADLAQTQTSKVALVPAKVSLPSVERAYSMGFGIEGGRKKYEIMRIVRSNLAGLSHTYNKFLRANPSNGGTVTLKWAIDEFGNVLNCEVINSTLENPNFEKELVRRIKQWQFGVIRAPGDVTTVVFPFEFAIKSKTMHAFNAQ